MEDEPCCELITGGTSLRRARCCEWPQLVGLQFFCKYKPFFSLQVVVLTFSVHFANLDVWFAWHLLDWTHLNFDAPFITKTPSAFAFVAVQSSQKRFFIESEISRRKVFQEGQSDQEGHRRSLRVRTLPSTARRLLPWCILLQGILLCLVASFPHLSCRHHDLRLPEIHLWMLSPHSPTSSGMFRFVTRCSSHPACQHLKEPAETRREILFAGQPGAMDQQCELTTAPYTQAFRCMRRSAFDQRPSHFKLKWVMEQWRREWETAHTRLHNYRLHSQALSSLNLLATPSHVTLKSALNVSAASFGGKLRPHFTTLVR